MYQVNTTQSRRRARLKREALALAGRARLCPGNGCYCPGYLVFYRGLFSTGSVTMAIIELFPELPGRADMHDAAAELASGLHGSFARRIGEAYQLADEGNKARLTRAFPDLFDKALAFRNDRA
jgi:hypothetical protein